MEKKNEQSIGLSHIIKPFYFLFFALLLEVVNFLWLKFKVTGNASLVQILPTYFLFDAAFFALAIALIFVSKRVLANIFYYLFLGLQIVLNMVNAALYKVYGDLFSLDMLALGGEAADSLKLEFIDLKSIAVHLAILAVIIATQVVCDRLIKKQFSLPKASKNAILLVGFYCLVLFGGISLSAQMMTLRNTPANQVITSDRYLWDNAQNKNEAFKKFGTYGFYLNNIVRLSAGEQKPSDAEVQDILLKLEQGRVDENPDAPLYGDNLIMILLESFEWFAIDPYNTPTLWDMKTSSGVAMTNFYARNKTNVSEDVTLLGNMPNNTSIVRLAEEGNLCTGYSLPSMLKEQGYTANFFHANDGKFYERKKVNTALGFDNVFDIYDADIADKSLKFNLWNKDSDFVSSLIDSFIPAEGRFMSCLTTITTHGTYDILNPRLEQYYTEYDANFALFKEWLTQSGYILPSKAKDQARLKEYKCAAMDTDRLVKLILDNLEEKGIKDNTTLVLYADHDCFYEDLAFKVKGTKKSDFENVYNYNVPLMIYSSKLDPHEETGFCNTYDIYPTICSLMGLPYNKLLAEGQYIFGQERNRSVMVSFLSGMFTDKIFSLNGVDLVFRGEVTSEDVNVFKNSVVKFFEKQKMIEKIYAFDLL